MKVGQIVKFKNSDGTLNGGTIAGFQKNSLGSDVVLINTLDGNKVTVSYDKCIGIKHQIIGKQSKAFIDKVKKDIEIHNNGVNSNPDNKKQKEELQLWINKYNELSNVLTDKNHEIETLIKENNELIEKYRSKDNQYKELEELNSKLQKDLTRNTDSQENLHYTIIGLKKAILAGVDNNHKEQIETLLDVIMDLIGVN